jgi:hypothetical protein
MAFKIETTEPRRCLVKVCLNGTNDTILWIKHAGTEKRSEYQKTFTWVTGH